MKHSENQTCGDRFSRRDFLRLSALSAGTVVATSALPSFADDPSVFPKRGTAERLVLAYQHIPIGLKEPFSILHISDTHLTAAYPNEADGADKMKSMARRTCTFGGAASVAPDARGDYKRQLEDPVTRDFIAYLKGEPLVKGILTVHVHITVQDRFSPTAMQYVVGGNFRFHGEEVLFT